MRKSLFNSVYDEFLKQDGFSCLSFQEKFPETIGVISLPQIRSRRNLLTCGVRRKNRVKTYSENYSKRYVQKLLIKEMPIHDAKVVALLGPIESSFDYLKMLINSGIVLHHKINSWENDFNIFEEQTSSAFLQNYVKFNFGDVSKCNVTNYMDIDLKCSYKSCKSLIEDLFDSQQKLSGKKVFNFTYSVNWLDKQSVHDVIIESVSSLVCEKCSIKTIIQHSNPSEKIYAREYILSYKGKFDIKVFWYYDSSPMISISILTK